MPDREDQSKSKSPSSHGDVARGVLRDALCVANNALEGCPIWGPKAAVSAILEVLDGIDQTEQNEKTLKDLNGSVNKLIQVVLKPISGITDDAPDDLKTDIAMLDANLNHLVTEWKDRSARSPFRRFLSRKRDLDNLVSLERKLKDVLDRFQTRSTVCIRHIQHQAETNARARDEKIREGIAQINQLKLLDRLPRAEFASYDSGYSDTRSACFEGTRTAVLKEIEDWFRSTTDDSPRLFWLNGMAGIGKSTIAQSVANRAHELGVLGASFFFSRQDAKLSNPRLIFPEIAFQLAKIHPGFKTRVAKALDADPDIGTKMYPRQFSELITKPIAGDDSIAGFVIILDALDECEEDGVTELLKLLMPASRPSFPLFVFITSRPAYHIRGILDTPGTLKQVVLHDIEKSVVQGDIEHYVRSRLAEIPKSLHLAKLKNDWVDEESIRDLLSNCGGLFVYAATALRFIANKKVLNPKLQLDRVTQARPASGSKPHAELDALYLQILDNAVPNTEDEYMLDQFQNVIGTIVLLRDPLPITALAELVGLTAFDVMSALAHLYSIILIPPPPDDAPRVYHPSFPDFITNPSRCTDQAFLIDSQEHHCRLALCCFTRMESLKRNMLYITDPSLTNSEIPHLDVRVRDGFPPELQYACRYWSTHLVQVESGATKVLAAFGGFLSQWLLVWLEVMSLLGSMLVALESIKNAKNWAINHANNSELYMFLSDTHRFILENFNLIKGRALHTYYSALPFTPRSNRVYQTYHAEFTQDTVQVLQGLASEWSPHMTLGGHSEAVASIALSHDGIKMASGSHDKTIRIWDPTTGAHVVTLEGHSSYVTSVAFSRDGTILASGSHDKTVRMWDPTTGAHLVTLEGHSSFVTSVAFSHDGAKLTSGSRDNTIRIWDPTTNAHLFTLRGHSGVVFSVAFSPDSTKLASGSSDNTIRIWDPTTGANLVTLEGHTNWVTSVAFSCDGVKLASGSRDKTICIWDPTVGAHLVTLKGHSDTVTSVAFSRDGMKLASGSLDDTIRIWDPTSGAHLVTLEGHSSYITSVAFSRDGTKLTSSSRDNTIRIWDPTPGAHLVILEGHWHSDIITSVAFSRDGTKLASGSYDDTIRIWDPTTGAHLIALEGHSDTIASVTFSRDGMKLASGSRDKTIRIWDPTTGAHLVTLQGHSGVVFSVAFSRDSMKLASGSRDKTIRIWDPTTGAHLVTLAGYSSILSITSVTFSHDGTKLNAPSYSKLEDMTTWDLPDSTVLDPHNAIHPNKTGTTSPSVADPDEPQVEDLSYGLDDHHWLCVQRSQGEWRKVCYIPPEYSVVDAVGWHMQCVAIGCHDGRVLILDLSRVKEGVIVQ